MVYAPLLPQEPQETHNLIKLHLETTTPSLENARDSLRSPVDIKNIGSVVRRYDIPTTYDGFQYAPEYQIEYPEVVISCIEELLGEYDKAFAPLIEANRDMSNGEEDAYRYCYLSEDGEFSNYFVQVDMAGLSHDFLEMADRLPRETVKDLIRERIFEFENSLAMYNFMRGIFSEDGHTSDFAENFDIALNELRELSGKQIALLAVTPEKYQAMKATEFGKAPEEDLSDEEVRQLSGFDKFFSPDEFQTYISSVGEDNSDYILYVRSSFPSSALKTIKAGQTLPSPEMLKDPNMRRVIKKYSITPNIDKPDLPPNDMSIINDTKRYLLNMGLGVEINQYEDLFSAEFTAFLAARGVAMDYHTKVRVKALSQYYGAIGHAAGYINADQNSVDSRQAVSKFREEIRSNLRKRGPHIAQNEIPAAVILDSATGQRYKYIDRIWFGRGRFMGGKRNMIPDGHFEAHKGNIHGNEDAVWAQIKVSR